MSEVQDLIARGGLVTDVRRLLQRAADDHGVWLRDNIRHALKARGQDAVSVSALTGVAPGTVRGFLGGRPSSIRNVLLIAEAAGFTLAQLDQPPERFRELVAASMDEEGGVIGPSLLAFDEASMPMAITLLDGTIVKVNRQLRTLLGYSEGELIGRSAETFAVRGAEDRATRERDIAASDLLPARATPLRRKDGSIVEALTSAIVVRDEAGEPRYVIARAAPLA